MPSTRNTENKLCAKSRMCEKKVALIKREC